MDTMIDWKLAATVAEGIAGMKAAPDAARFEHVAGPAEESARLVSEYTGLRADALADPPRLVSEYTGLRADALPHPEPVDRPLWIQSNLNSLRTVIDPVTDTLGSNLGAQAAPSLPAGRALIAVEVGAISGMLAKRVRGQYEFPILEPEALARLL